MRAWMKIGIVLAGYVLAALVSGGTVYLYDQRFTEADNQTMGGMIAGGEMLYGGAIFALLSLLPTGLALRFLRRSRLFWSCFTLAGLTFAIVGFVAVLSPIVTGWQMRSPLMALFGFFSVVQMLGSPLWIGSFALFAALAPPGDMRRRMLVATGFEVVIAGCALIHFLVPRPPF